MDKVQKPNNSKCRNVTATRRKNHSLASRSVISSRPVDPIENLIYERPGHGHRLGGGMGKPRDLPSSPRFLGKKFKLKEEGNIPNTNTQMEIIKKKQYVLLS
jgi:hypothetical protein